MADRDERVVAWTELVALPDEFLQVGRSPHLRQQPTHQLPSQHVRDPAEDGAAKLQRVLHHQHLPLVLGAGEVLVGLLNTQTYQFFMVNKSKDYRVSPVGDIDPPGSPG